MKFNPLVIAFGLIPLVGCGGGSDSTDTVNDIDIPSELVATYTVKAVDGYLRNAQVWLDTTGNNQLDDGEPTALSTEGGIAELNVDGIENPEQYRILVKAIAEQTIDEDTITTTNPTGVTISSAYLLSAPAGQTVISPFSTLVDIEIESGVTKEDAITNIANDLGIDGDKLLEDYIAQEESIIASKANAIVELDILPTSAEEMVAASSSTISVTVLDQLDDVVLSKLLGLTGDTLLVMDEEGNITTEDNADSDDDGIIDTKDAFPEDPTEWYDTDGDGTGNNADAFDNDPTETTDTDNDGTGDNSDAFPSNPAESKDTDGDGTGDNADAFDNDATENTDTDGDGVGDNTDVFPTDATETIDTDEDGTGDNSDAFPTNAAESKDTDEDGVGDNADIFPTDATETIDTDEDGTGDNSDGFPTDDSETTDTDGDGVGDNSDAFPLDDTETTDTDGDGVGDNSDTFPSDPNKMEGPDSIFTTLQNSGIAWFGGYTQDQDVTLEYGTFSVDTDGTISEAVFLLENGVWVTDDHGYDSYQAYVLTNQGWATTSEEPLLATSDTDQTVTFHYDQSELDEKLTGMIVDLEGLSIATEMSKVDDDGTWSQQVPENMIFPSGSIGYIVTTGLINSDFYYRFDENTDCQPDDLVNGVCNSVSIDGTSALELNDLVADTAFQQSNTSADMDNLIGIDLGWKDGKNLIAELLEDKTVNFYVKDHGNQTITLFIAGTWTDTVISGQTIRTILRPDSLIQEGFDGHFEDNGDIIVFEYENAVRIGTQDYNGGSGGFDNAEESDLIFNDVAKDAILASVEVDETNETSNFTTEMLVGKTLYNLYTESIDETDNTPNYWEVSAFTFTENTLSGYVIGHKGEEDYTISETPYEITDEGYLSFTVTNDGDKEIAIISEIGDYQLVCWANAGYNFEDGCNHDTEFFFYDLESAQEYIVNNPIVDVTTNNIPFTEDMLTGKTLFNVYTQSDEGTENSSNYWEVSSFTFIDGTVSAYVLGENEDSVKYSYKITDEGYLTFDNDHISIVSDEGDSLKLCWNNSIEELASNCYDTEEFFFYDLTTANEYIENNTDL